jgi:predicted nicotinamide N-methyase
VTTEIGARVGGFHARLTHVAVGRDRVPLWQVEDLEAHVDRDALLRDDDGVEPPYWAHLWSGARLLAAAVPRRAGRVLELGCGLGLPTLTAARRGADVIAVDREPAALAFVRASARSGGGRGLRAVAADFRHLPLVGRFDLVLLAEVLYDRGAFDGLARSLTQVLAPRGEALVTDARRIDTTGFYDRLEARGLRWSATEFLAMEEGNSVRVRLARITRRDR